ncbi:hypothetical protein [Limnochorda pilosa]|mgnify:FL=1|uniref:hypothetical protein n=1 Tax=Limnochorda pilosa TaxID=1555112 RepID=UPI0026F303D8|nr:hypothetical protein [Limnochorda pilosa]
MALGPARGRPLPWLPILLVLGLGVALAAWLGGGGRPGPPPPPDEGPAPPRLEGVTVDGFLEGELQWTLEVGALAEGEGAVALEGVERGLFYRDEDPWLTLRAARGRWIPATNGLELEGQVEMELTSGGRLETEAVAWHGEAGRLEAASQVRATLAGDRLTAGRLTADAATGILHLAGGVEVVRPDGQRLTADGARWFDGEERLELVGPIDWVLPTLPDR